MVEWAALEGLSQHSYIGSVITQQDACSQSLHVQEIAERRRSAVPSKLTAEDSVEYSRCDLLSKLEEETI